MERHTQERESLIIKEYFINNKSLCQISAEQRISPEQVRIVRKSGLRRLRVYETRCELPQKLEAAEGSLYYAGLERFKEPDSCVVGFTVLPLEKIKTEYQQRMQQIEDIYVHKRM